jgi:putative nucleotidyltransferase with HDIG domain
MAKKNAAGSSKDTKSIKVIQIGKKHRIRIPSFFSPQISILLGMVVSIVLLFPYTITVENFSLPKLGEAAKETIIAPFTFDIIRSAEDLERERKKAAEKVFLVVDYNRDIRKTVLQKFSNYRVKLEDLINKHGNDTAKIEYKGELSRELSENSIAELIKRPYLIEDTKLLAGEILDKGLSATLLVPTIERLSELRSLYNTSFEQYLLYDKQYITMRKDSMEMAVAITELPVKEIALEKVIKGLRSERRLDDAALNTIYELLFISLKPNVIVNGAETAQRKQFAAQEVLEISGKVINETEIVRKHQEVTPEIIQKLRSLRIAMDRMENVREARKVMTGNTGRLLIVLLPLIFVAVYIARFEKVIAQSPKHTSALALLFILQLCLIRLGLMISPRLIDGLQEISAVIPEYLIPIAVGSLLASILFSLQISFILTLYISMFFSVVMGFNQFFFIYSLLGGLLTGFLGRNIRYRWHFFQVIPPVAFISVIVITLWHIIGFKIYPAAMLQNYGLSLISVIISVFLAMTFTSVFERIFDITTDMTLVELSDMNHPILKRLSIEAAGTYNHSVLVGNLAESAAQKIGANPLLARVSSYYHDIGKIEKSDYFVENCLAIDKNRHNKLAPSMSALIICSHVKDGVELARRHRLPKVIQDMILQHHGNSTVSFFYEKAREQDPHNQVQEQDFRYPGPLPQTKEAAIIMLADSVEAASRSLGTSSPKLLRELVKKIIRDKFISAQLDQSDLTLKDLDDIVEGFMPVLQGIFHSRIEYPSKDKGA